MFRTNKPSQHFQEVYNCIAKNREAYIPMMSNEDLEDFIMHVLNYPIATRFIITAYRANMKILNLMYRFMKVKTNEDK